jgi:hypothetical protein
MLSMEEHVTYGLHEILLSTGVLFGARRPR